MVNIEEQLWMTLEGLRNAMDVSPYVLSYWELTADETVSKIARIFRDDRVRNCIMTTQIVETCTLVFLHFLMHEGTISPSVLG